MKRPKGWALAVALQIGACGMAGCNTAPPLPGVGSRASAQPQQSVEQMLAAAKFMENQGVQQHDPEKLEIARQGYMTVLSRNPQNQFAHHRLAILAARGGQFDAAEVHFQKAAESGAVSSELLADMGYNLYLQNRLEEAEQSLRSAVAKDSRNEAAINNLGLVLGEMGRADDALAHFEQVVGTAQAHANLAKVYTHLGQLDEAKDQYNLALSIDQDLRNAAEALVQLEDATSAQRMAHEHAQAQLASNRRRGERRSLPQPAEPRSHRELPELEELHLTEQQPRYAAEVRPVSEQQPIQTAPQPVKQDGFFDVDSGVMPAREYTNIKPQHETHRAPLQQPQQSMAEMAAGLGQPEESLIQQDAPQPAPQPAQARVNSSADELRASLAQQQHIPEQHKQEQPAQQQQRQEQPARYQPVQQQPVAMVSEPPLPQHQEEQLNSFPPPQVATPPAIQQPELQSQPVVETAAPDIYPQAKIAENHTTPERIVNPYVVQQQMPAQTAPQHSATAQEASQQFVPQRLTSAQSIEPRTLTTPAEEELAPLPGSTETFVAKAQPAPQQLAQQQTAPQQTHAVEMPQVPSQHIAESAQETAPAAARFASADAVDDLPVGEPNLGPIAASPQPARPVVTANRAPAAGAPLFDYRKQADMQPRSLQKLLDDDDY